MLHAYAGKRKRGRPARTQPMPEPGGAAEDGEEEEGDEDDEPLSLTGTVGKRERKALHPAVSVADGGR